MYKYYTNESSSKLFRSPIRTDLDPGTSDSFITPKRMEMQVRLFSEKKYFESMEVRYLYERILRSLSGIPTQLAVSWCAYAKKASHQLALSGALIPAKDSRVLIIRSPY